MELAIFVVFPFSCHSEGNQLTTEPNRFLLNEEKIKKIKLFWNKQVFKKQTLVRRQPILTHAHTYFHRNA